MDAPNITIEEKILALKGPILIFGGSGFIGANLLNTILNYRQDCFAIVRTTASLWRLELLKINKENIIYCDITDRQTLATIFNSLKPKTIFNLAAYGSNSEETDSDIIYQTNLIGTLNILNESNNISAYIHAGSSSEYGFNCQSPSESDELQPNSHYAISKVSTSYLIKYYSRINNLPAVNLRLYSIYGDWEKPNRLIPQLVEKLKTNVLPPLASPDISRDFIYINDCLEAFINAAYFMKPEMHGRSINIGSGQQTTLEELVDTAQTLLKTDLQPAWQSMPDRKWDVKNWYGNYQKANQLINWQPKTLLVDGLKKYSMWQDNINYQSTVLPIYKTQRKKHKISCIIACYRDAEAIPIMYKRLLKVFSTINVDYEIIFVNDSSPDNTQEILEKICKDNPRVIAITHSRNFGSQSAFMSGLEIASGNTAVLMDGDLQDPPEIIPQFYNKWQEGYEVVYGKRVKRETSFVLNICYKLFYKLFSKLSYINIPRDTGDFSMIDRIVINQLLALPEKDQFIRGLRAWVGFDQIGVDYTRPERMFGKTTNNWRKNIWWAKKAIFSFSFAPLEALGYAGFSLTILSFVAIVVQICIKLIYPDVPQGLSTIIVLVLFFGGIQMLAISILGEYLAKIFEETKGRPKFIRKSVIHKGQKIAGDKIDHLINKH